MRIDIEFKRKANPRRYDRIWRRKYNRLTGNIKRKLADYRYMDRKAGYTVCDYKYSELLHILSTNRCYYCGFVERLTLDRIDNTKGHTKDNTVVCCTICNTIRMDIFTTDEMKKIGPFVRQILSDRKK